MEGSTVTNPGNPFEGLYTPDEDQPVAPPPTSTAGLPTAPQQGGVPLAPAASATPGIPVAAPVEAPVSPYAEMAVAPPAEVAPSAYVPQAPSAPVAPVAPAPVPVVGYAPGPIAPVYAAVPDGPVAPLPASTPSYSQADGDEAVEKVSLDDMLVAMVDAGGSDLHLAADAPPKMRVRGEIQTIKGYGALTAQQLHTVLYGMMSSKQRQRFEESLELDFSYTVPGQARFRVNVLKQRGSIGAVMRTIPWEILSLDALGLPDIIGEFAGLENGLVLITGPTGSGKSTTLAAIIDKANRTRNHHIMTIEDPIEFIHQSRGCVVNQREVGEDTHSFQDALKHVLRQDPDIILVGELRDLETISVALTAAETGHLVFATLHTQSAQDTITRMIDVFPADQQAQVQTQLAASLRGVVCQTLCRTSDGAGRQAAVEIMIATSNVQALIRDKKLQQVQGALQSGAKFGMQTLNQDLAKHVLEGTIDIDTALTKCSDRDDLLLLVGGRENADKIAKRVAEARAPKPNDGSLYGGYPTPPLG